MFLIMITGRFALNNTMRNSKNTPSSNIKLNTRKSIQKSVCNVDCAVAPNIRLICA